MEQSAMVQATFSLGVGDATLNLSVPVPAGETTVTELLPVLQAVTNRVVGFIVEHVEASGRHISCRAGCGACCRQLVPLSLFEAEALGAWILTLPEEQQASLRARFHAALVALRDHGILDRLQPELWEEGSPAAREAVLDYLAAGVPCPFLVDESCSIHPMRPLICREYLVTSPPAFCAVPRAEQVDGVRMPVKLSKALYRMGMHLEGGSIGWIPLVFLMHWMQSGAAPGRRFKGAGPRVIYDVLSSLEA